MQAHSKLTREQERELMSYLMLRRERQSDHRGPEWLHRFWRGVAA
ncbi:hypothetical protein [Herbaspirillum sp. ST 5-3]|nr:hypothetical protein [Herbaspirillum sp. ST 5-3]